MQVYDPLRFNKTVLDNGAPVYLNLDLPVRGVLIGVVFPRGSRDDAAGQEGVGHFMEHMPFKGTRHFPDKLAIALPIERCGGTLSAYTAQERIVFWARVMPEDVATAASALQELTASALNRTKDFKKEMGVIIEEWKQQYADAEARCLKVFLQQLFGDHPLAHLPIGEKAAIESLHVKDIVQMYDQYVRNGAFALFAIGNARKNEILPVLGRIFGKRRMTHIPRFARSSRLPHPHNFNPLSG